MSNVKIPHSNLTFIRQTRWHLLSFFMSVPSKIVLSSACAFTVGTIGYVHYKQHLDRTELHRGVLLDTERRQRRKQENIYVMQKQSQLQKQLEEHEAMERRSQI